MNWGTVKREDAPRLLLVEDDDGVRRGLQLLLEGQGFAVQSFASAGPVVADPDSLTATHLVVDYALPDQDGVHLVEALRKRGWKGIGVLITAYATEPLREAAQAAGFAAVIDKPFRDSQLLNALDGRRAAPGPA
ncbi:response regulator [Stakelama tenebrarum]|uniref:response regulator n=1 Tax=Stakelama tenebrarum TaxID=2711215 RepID=UPI001D1982FD|nr:response regulator [Sphingosinithalassobacter tenebrarum]